MTLRTCDSEASPTCLTFATPHASSRRVRSGLFESANFQVRPPSCTMAQRESLLTTSCIDLCAELTKRNEARAPNGAGQIPDITGQPASGIPSTLEAGH
jgi:hypothetical protein